MSGLQDMLALGEWLRQHPQIMLYSSGGLLALTLLGSLTGRRRRPQETHGSARLATLRDVRQAGLLGPHGVVLGRFQKRLLHDDSERHIWLQAPSQSGKGVGVIGCSGFDWWESMLTFDPTNGETLAIAAAWRAQWSRVEVFTPHRSPQTCINVSDSVRWGTYHEPGDVRLISTSLVAPAYLSLHPSEAGEHFRMHAASLIDAAHLFVHYTMPPASLPKVWWFLMQHANLGACLDRLEQTPVTTGGGRHPTIVEKVRVLRSIGSREVGSIWSTACTPLMPYADPLIARSTSQSTVNLDDLQYGPVPMSLYLVAESPAVLRTVAPVYRVIAETALAVLQRHRRRSFRWRLLWIADECPAYGYMAGAALGAATMAGNGIKGLFVTQDHPMMEQVYGRENAIWGNTRVKVFHAPANDETAKRLAGPLVGQSTVEQPVESQQQRGRSISYQHVGRDLLTADEILGLGPTQQLVRWIGCPAIVCTKTNYLLDTEYAERRAA